MPYLTVHILGSKVTNEITSSLYDRNLVSFMIFDLGLYILKGIVQRKLTGIKSGINR
jgi:hypothetical protein